MPQVHQDHQKYIVEGFRNGNRERIQEIYEHFFEKILAWIKNHQGKKKDAEDIFQESMIVLTISAQNPAFYLTCPLGGFLSAIWRNKWMDVLRKRKKLEQLEVVILDQYKESQMEAERLAEKANADAICFLLLEKTFFSLSDTCQRLLELYKLETPVKEMIKLLEMPEANTYYRRKSACIDQWRKNLRKEPDYDHCKFISQ